MKVDKKRMKRFCALMSAIVWVATTGLWVSCREDDEWGSNGSEGRPGTLSLLDEAKKTEVGGIAFAYTGDRIAGIRSAREESVWFTYEGGNLTSIAFEPPPRVADGHGSTRFEYDAEKNKIRVKSTGEPTLSMVWMEEIELDESGDPVRITELGYYQRGENGSTCVKEGESYRLFSFDPATRQLTEQTTYRRTDDALLSRCTYEYDDLPGVTSRIELPRWFRAYVAYRRGANASLYQTQFLNDVHNLVKETVRWTSGGFVEETHYTYTCNSNGYPVTAVSDREPSVRLVIRY